jgi:hypothetical protein
MISSFVDAHRALLRRLPYELLQEILIYCVQPDTGHALTDCAKAPIRLGQVCSGWRRTVMSTPHLWSFLYISIDDDMFFL